MFFAGSIIGGVCIYIHKIKNTLKKEIVEPEIELIKESISHKTDIAKEQQIRQDARISKIEKRIEELENSQEKKLDAIFDKLSEVSDKNANISGKMELLLDKFVKN